VKISGFVNRFSIWTATIHSLIFRSGDISNLPPAS
jgi:hypothetical protein